MTREDIIAWARDAGLIPGPSPTEALERFAALVAAREREACVRSLDDAAESAKLQSITDMLKKAAAIVRARGETK